MLHWSLAFGFSTSAVNVMVTSCCGVRACSAASQYCKRETGGGGTCCEQGRLLAPLHSLAATSWNCDEADCWEHWVHWRNLLQANRRLNELYAMVTYTFMKEQLDESMLH